MPTPKQKQYLVKWEIDISAYSPIQAAREALEIMQDFFSEATCFTVTECATQKETYIDLNKE